MNHSFPVDPDSIIEPSPQPRFADNDGISVPPAILPRFAAGDKPSEQPLPPPLKPARPPASDALCCPFAKADNVNEKYAALIRSSFSGRESELTLALGYLYQSIRFAVCSQELCQTLYLLALSRFGCLKILGDLLLSLGGEPRFFCTVPSNAVAGSWWNASPTVMRYPRHLGEGLQSSLKLETASVSEYKSIIAYIDDGGVISALKDIVCQKERDIEKLSLLYTRFCG